MEFPDDDTLSRDVQHLSGRMCDVLEDARDNLGRRDLADFIGEASRILEHYAEDLPGLIPPPMPAAA